MTWLARFWGVLCASGLLLVEDGLFAQDFTYTNSNGTITITGYTGPGGDVVIPSTIEGLPVTSIGDGAFSWTLNFMGGAIGLSNLTAITIPDSITNLGEAAFAGCPNLATINFGKGITRIKGGLGTQSWGTFQWCSRLTSVTIPDTVTNIGDSEIHLGGALGAFFGCQGLTNVIIGKGLTYLGVGSFNWCENLRSVYFRGNAPTPGVDFFGEDNFHPDEMVTLYYLPGTTGWRPTFANRPTVLWNPEVVTTDGNFGVRQNRFGFNIAGTADLPIVVEATTSLLDGPWVPLQTCTLTNGLVYFSDPQWTNDSQRIYRIRSP